MEYLTTCYRRRGEGGCSLLLQQYLCRQTPVCFACLCTAEGSEGSRTCRDTAESFLNWSRKVPWHKAAVRPAMWMERFERELTDLPEAIEAKLTLFLCIEGEILVLGGGQNLSLLSTSFGRGKAIGLPGQFRGHLEPGAGLLLATDGFLKNVSGKSLEEALRLQEIKTAEQAERHLRELASPREPASFRKVAVPGEIAEQDRTAGGGPAAAILLVGR
ncbi:MAG: hypothetical protein K2K63_02470 [Acetatifactor sp.]|nr:hypothetical protein [Acetatifactor sp.]